MQPEDVWRLNVRALLNIIKDYVRHRLDNVCKNPGYEGTDHILDFSVLNPERNIYICYIILTYVD